MRTLGFVLATGVARADVRHVHGLALAARARGIEVRVFAMHAGIAALAAAGALVAELLDCGCEVIGCASSADRLAIDLAALGVGAGSQDDHAALCGWADRVVAFT